MVCNISEEEKQEREARSVALEKTYVHDVYDQLSHHFAVERYRPWPRVRQFLENLEPGSLVCDAGIFIYTIISNCYYYYILCFIFLLTNKTKPGCGSGKYLNINPTVFKVGSDRCASLIETARRKDHEVRCSSCICSHNRNNKNK